MPKEILGYGGTKIAGDRQIFSHYILSGKYQIGHFYFSSLTLCFIGRKQRDAGRRRVTEHF